MPYDPKKDPYGHFDDQPDYPGGAGKMAVLSDTVDLVRYAKRIVMVKTGDVVYLPVENDDADTLTFTGLPAGWKSPHRVRRVLATGTTAAAVATVDE